MATAYGTGAPLVGASGLITSYANSPGGAANAQKPIYGANGLISGYSTGAGDTPNQPVNAYLASNPNDPTQKYNFNPTTGLNPQGLNKGQQAAADYQASTQTVSNTKSAPIAAATATTLGNENQLQGNLVKSFADYLNEAKQLQQSGADQVKQDTSTLNAAPAQLQSNLSDVVKQFANTTGALDTKVTDLNAANAATVSGNIAQSKQNIADYQTAAEAVANQAIAAGQSRFNAAKSASGTPTSDSGYGRQFAATNTASILLPVEQQIAQMKQSNLTSYISPQEQNLYANNISQVTGLEMPIAQTLVQYGITDANQVAQLQAQLSGKALNEQIAYLSSLGMPVQLAQQVAASLPGAISQLGAIDNANTFYGLAQDYQNPVATGLPTYNPGTPQYGGNRSNDYPYSNSPLPNTGNVQSGQQPVGQQPGPPVGINARGQLVDANGNIVSYAAPVNYNGPSLPPPNNAPYYAPPLAGGNVGQGDVIDLQSLGEGASGGGYY